MKHIYNTSMLYALLSTRSAPGDWLRLVARSSKFPTGWLGMLVNLVSGTISQFYNHKNPKLFTIIRRWMTSFFLSSDPSDSICTEFVLVWLGLGLFRDQAEVYSDRLQL